jgi:hypothetical protein
VLLKAHCDLRVMSTIDKYMAWLQAAKTNGGAPLLTVLGQTFESLVSCNDGWDDGTDLGTGSLQRAALWPGNHRTVHQLALDGIFDHVAQLIVGYRLRWGKTACRFTTWTNGVFFGLPLRLIRSAFAVFSWRPWVLPPRIISSCISVQWQNSGERGEQGDSGIA